MAFETYLESNEAQFSCVSSSVNFQPSTLAVRMKLAFECGDTHQREFLLSLPFCRSTWLSLGGNDVALCPIEEGNIICKKKRRVRIGSSC